MKTTEMPKSACITCGAKFTVASDVQGDNSPVTGDVSVCLYCGEIAIFDERMMLRSITESEICELPLIILQQLQAARSEIIKANALTQPC